MFVFLGVVQIIAAILNFIALLISFPSMGRFDGLTILTVSSNIFSIVVLLISGLAFFVIDSMKKDIDNLKEVTEKDQKYLKRKIRDIQYEQIQIREKLGIDKMDKKLSVGDYVFTNSELKTKSTVIEKHAGGVVSEINGEEITVIFDNYSTPIICNKNLLN